MSKGTVNKVILVGRVGNMPEITSPNGCDIANLSLATTDSYKNKSGEYVETTEWHKIVVFGGLASKLMPYVSKGSRLYVEGSLKTQKWHNDAGTDKYKTEVVAKIIELLDKKAPALNDISSGEF